MDRHAASGGSSVDRARPERRARVERRPERPLVVLPHVSLWGRVKAGGTRGNERLTVITGLVLIVLFAALGVTIVFIGRLLWLHLFLGLVLLGPVALKLASTGYRFIRYYTHDAAYRHKGPPPPLLRGLAPLVVILTVAVFATGVALLFTTRASSSLLQLAHKAAFIGWVAATGLHVLGHLPETVSLLVGRRRDRRELSRLLAALGPRAQGSHAEWPSTGDAAWSPRLSSGLAPASGGLTDASAGLAYASVGLVPASGAVAQPSGSLGRRIALLLAPLGGLILALALTGQFSAWTG